MLHFAHMEKIDKHVLQTPIYLLMHARQNWHVLTSRTWPHHGINSTCSLCAYEVNMAIKKSMPARLLSGQDVERVCMQQSSARQCQNLHEKRAWEQENGVDRASLFDRETRPGPAALSSSHPKCSSAGQHQLPELVAQLRHRGRGRPQLGGRVVQFGGVSGKESRGSA